MYLWKRRITQFFNQCHRLALSACLTIYDYCNIIEVARPIGLQCGESEQSVESVLKKKRKATVGRICGVLICLT